MALSLVQVLCTRDHNSEQQSSRMTQYLLMGHPITESVSGHHSAALQICSGVLWRSDALEVKAIPMSSQVISTYAEVQMGMPSRSGLGHSPSGLIMASATPAVDVPGRSTSLPKSRASQDLLNRFWSFRTVLCGGMMEDEVP
jgi:hypothetical protein